MSNNIIQNYQNPSHAPVPCYQATVVNPARQPTKTKILGAVLVVAALVSATGCGFIQKQTADSWSVTYEVEVQGFTINVLENVSFDEAFSRGEESETVTKGEVVTTNLSKAKNQAKWTTTAMVTAGSRASVAAKPLPGSTATCRILLDETRELITKADSPERQWIALSTPRHSIRNNGTDVLARPQQELYWGLAFSGIQKTSFYIHSEIAVPKRLRSVLALAYGEAGRVRGPAGGRWRQNGL